MAEVNAAELPDELGDVQVGAQMSLRHRLAHEPFEHLNPPSLALHEVITDRPFGIVKLECGTVERAATGQPRTRGPAEPPLHHQPQPWQSRRRFLGRGDHLARNRLLGGAQERELRKSSLEVKWANSPLLESPARVANPPRLTPARPRSLAMPRPLSMIRW